MKRTGLELASQVMKLLESLTKAYEPYRMPVSYLADCIVMTHAVLRQLEQERLSSFSCAHCLLVPTANCFVPR